MASRYTAEALLLLRQSPLCVKPPNLPPAEQWMGQPTDHVRNQTRTALDKPKSNDGSFATDPATGRSASDRHTTRNASGSEEIVLGPPKMTFASASSLRSTGIKLAADSDRPSRGSERFGLRGRSDQSDANNYNGNGNYGNGSADRSRDNRNNRRRGDADQDGEGWSTVKPRKSFGHEGAERFHGRMGGAGAGGSGGAVERYGRDDRRTRDRDDGDAGARDRTRRTFERDGTGRSGGDENEGPRRNGGIGGRGPWFKDSSGNEERSERTDRTERSDRNAQRERIDRTKNWRERNPDYQPGDSYREKNNERSGGRRWDRDRDYFQRTEREPEWLDESGSLGDEPMATGGHTEEDLRQFMEAMKGRGGGAAAAAKADKPDDSHENETGNKGSRPELTPAIEHGPDRFFEQFTKSSKAEDANAAASTAEAKKEAGKAKGGKSSRFTSFFTAQEDTRRQSDTPTQQPAGAVQQSPPVAGPSGAPVSPPDAAEKEAFQALLLKLQRQTLQGSNNGPPAGNTGGGGVPASNGTPPSAGGYQEMGNGGGAPLGNDSRQRSALTSPNPLYPTRQAVMEPPRDDPRFRGDMPTTGPLPQQILHEMLMQRPPPMAASQSPSASVRPEQMIQELLAQRQHVSSQGQGHENMPLRMGPGPGPGPGMGPGGAGGPGNGLDGGQGGMRPGSLPNGSLSNAQSEFLVQLMRNGGRARQQEELLMRMPQPRKQVNISSIPDRTADMVGAGDYGRVPQRQVMRGNQGPPGLYVDEQFARQDADGRPPTQPTQILQRPPPPPGLEQVLQHGQLPPFLQTNAGGRMSQQQQQGPQGPQQTQQQGPQQGPQQPMIPPPGLNNAPPTRQMAMPNLAMPNLANLPNMPNMPGMSMGGLPNMPNLPNMTLHNMPPNMFPNFPQQGPFSQDGIPGGPPRNMPPPPPPGFYGGPQGPPGFLPPNLGMGFQGPPDGMVFTFDGRGMPPMPPGVGYRRQ